MAADDSYVPHIMDSDMSEPWNCDQQMFDSGLSHDTPLDFNLFLNNEAFVSSPAAGSAALTGYGSPAKAFANRREKTPALSQPHSTLQPRSIMSSSSPDSSSQDSSSDTSTRRKRKLTSSDSSPSALFDGMDGHTGNGWHKDGSMRAMDTPSVPRDSMFVKREPREGGRALETDVDTINRSMASNFDFGSSASSPSFFGFGSPEQTVAPAKLEQLPSDARSQSTAPKSSGFFIGSRDESPMSGMSGSQDASPAAMFDGQSPAAFSNHEMFTGMSVWNGTGLNTTFQNGQWQNELSPTQANMHYPGSDALPFPTSMGGSQRRTVLYINQDGNKSRVETQINIRLTLDPLPSGASKLHLPTHTVSKPKLLAKQIIKDPDTLELHTSLVCASAMEKPELMSHALERAASYESNTRKSQPRRSSQGDMTDDDPDDPEKPANGGEVRICQNCVQRERKRAARKRVKKQEDEEAWAEYEYERVIVFNDKEYKEWQTPAPPKTDGVGSSVAFPPGAMQIEVPMRIACYCRHQSEKIGFRVIFTIKDYRGQLVAQSMTNPILITDDHKTQGAPVSTTSGMLPTDPLQQFNPPMLTANEQPEVQSSFHRRPYHSTNDLPGLQESWMHPVTSRQAALQATSTTMTPRNLSRQTSPVATQTAPNKKRKSSSTHHHHKLPRELTMTRVSTSASSPVTGAESANVSAPAPQTGPFMSSNDPQFMMQPITVPSYNSGPPTPGSNNGLVTPAQRQGSIENMAYQFYSVPTSAHHSRAPSPILGRPSVNAFPTTGISNVMGNPMNMMQQQIDAQRQGPAPQIYKVTPGEYSKSGGIEVSCLGSNFTRNMEILFGDTVATTTTFWNTQLLVCLLPPSPHAGPVPVTVRPTSQSGFSPSPIPGPSATFTYVDDEDQRICELALRILCQKQTGNAKADDYRGFARQIVSMASGPWASAMSGGGNMQQRSASGLKQMDTEDMLLRCLDLIDMDDSPHAPRFSLKNKTGASFLSLSCSLGYGRIVAGLLARGANPDSRDRGGYTPLMMAAMHGHSQIVRRLILKGADPMMRSLQGYLASDFATSEDVLNALQRVKSHRRTRSAGSASFSVRSRASSIASTHSLWESSTPSYISDFSSAEADYEDEGEVSEQPEEELSAAWTPSRRGSTKDIRTLPPPEAEDQPGMLSPAVAAAMNAWRENLTAQIHHFQQNMNWNLPNLQLPALPPMPNLPDYQAHPMMRRISSLVPHRSPPRTPLPSRNGTATDDYKWRDLFSTPAAPPAYEEIYPKNAENDMDMKKMSVAQAAADHLLDEECAERYDTVEAESSSSASDVRSKASLNVQFGKKSLSKEQQEQVRRAHAQKLKRIRSDRNLFFIWIPLLLIILCAMLRNRLPQLSAAASAFFGAVQDRTAGRVVEVA